MSPLEPVAPPPPKPDFPDDGKMRWQDPAGPRIVTREHQAGITCMNLEHHKGKAPIKGHIRQEAGEDYARGRCPHCGNVVWVFWLRPLPAGAVGSGP